MLYILFNHSQKKNVFEIVITISAYEDYQSAIQ